MGEAIEGCSYQDKLVENDSFQMFKQYIPDEEKIEGKDAK